MKINTASFKKDLKKILPGIEVLGEYKTMKTKLEVKCLDRECNYEWSVSPDNLLRKVKYGCPECSKKYANKRWQNKIKIWIKENRKDLILIGNLGSYGIWFFNDGFFLAYFNIFSNVTYRYYS